MSEFPAPIPRRFPAPGKRREGAQAPPGMMFHEGKLIPTEGVESVGFGASPIDFLAFGIAATLLGGPVAGAASLGADIAAQLGVEALPEDAAWWLKLAVPFGAGMLGGMGVARLLKGKTVEEAVPLVKQALADNPKAIFQLPSAPRQVELDAALAEGRRAPGLLQIPGIGETTASRTGRVFTAGKQTVPELHEAIPPVPREPYRPLTPQFPQRRPETTLEAAKAFETGTQGPQLTPREMGAIARQRAIQVEPIPRQPGPYDRGLPEGIGRDPGEASSLYGVRSKWTTPREVEGVALPREGPPAETGRIVGLKGRSLLEALKQAETPRTSPPSAAGTVDAVPTTKSGKSLLGSLKAQAQKEASQAKYAARIGLTPPEGGGGPVVETLEAGVGNPFGYLGSPILSRLERIGGDIGNLLVRKEGQKTYLEGKWLADNIQPLVDRLSDLSKPEAKNFIQAAESGVPAINKRVADAINHYYDVFGESGIAVRAQQAQGLDVTPIKGNYWMHVFEPEAIKKILADPNRLSAAVKQLVAAKKATTESEARYLLQKYMTGKTIGKDRPTGAEFERVGIPGWIDDPARAVLMRGSAIAKRIAERQAYGENDIIIRNLIHMGGFDQATANKLNQLMEWTIRRDPIEAGIKLWQQRAMTFNAITSLSLSGIVNLGQNSLLLLRTNMPNMIKAHLKFLAHPVKSYQTARQLGLYADIAQKRLYAELTGGAIGKIGTESLRFFSFSEKIVRAIADEAGKDWAKTIDRALLNPKRLLWVQKELGKLNFMPEDIQRILKQGGLSPNDVELVRASLVDQVAFLPRNARKSEFYVSTSVGPAIMQFKSFLLNTGRLLKTTIADEWRAGNKEGVLKATLQVFPTLAKALPALALIGEIPADLSAAARGSRRPYPITGDPVDLLGRAADNISQLGALGLGFEVIRGALNAKGYGRAGLELLLGPTASLVSEVGPRVGGMGAALLRGDAPEFERQGIELGRSAVRRIPYVGPALSNLGIGSTMRPPDFPDENTFDRLGLSQRSQNLYQYRRLMREIEHLRQQYQRGY